MQKTSPQDNEDFDLITITAEEEGERLDKILTARFQGEQSRTYFQHLIDQGKVLINGKVQKKRHIPQEGDEVQIFFIINNEINLEPENIPFDIIFEDESIIVINKPAGLVVHPAVGNWTGTLVNGLLYHCQQLNQNRDAQDLRPGIVHRLDKDTTGLIVAAKTSKSHQKLIEMFSNREIEKQYLAICLGNPGTKVINTLIGRHPYDRKKMAVLEEKGREAITQCQSLAFADNLSLVKINLETGRTHQIRVHMKHIGTPVLGDPVYGNSNQQAKYGINRQMLHAYSLKFKHPITNQLLEIKAPIPADMRQLIEKYFKNLEI